MDPSTVVVILAIHLVCSGGLFHLIGRRMPSHSGLQLWSLGAVLFGLAYVGRLGAGLEATQPLVRSLDAAMVLASLLYIGGLREFVGRPAFPVRTLAALVVLYLVTQGLVVAAWGAQGRYVLLNLSLGMLYGTISLFAATQARRTTGGSRPPFTLMAGLMGVLALMTLARGMSIAVEGTGRMYSGLPAQLYYALASLIAVMLGMNLLWLVFTRLNGELTELASRDALTRVLNRNGLDDVLTRHFAARGALPVTLLQVDLDHFKQINDGFGHAVGDAVLRAVAALLTSRMRGSDFVARVGGEEFLVGCVGADSAVAFALADRLRTGVSALEIPTTDGRRSVRCTASVGVSRRFAALAEWQGAWREADRALYAAKAAGRNRVYAFEGTTGQPVPLGA
jgi:diguanylate cyclase (GGDEF)-like protein